MLTVSRRAEYLKPSRRNLDTVVQCDGNLTFVTLFWGQVFRSSAAVPPPSVRSRNRMDMKLSPLVGDWLPET